MKRVLQRTVQPIYQFRKGKKIQGPPSGVRGDLSEVFGNLTGVNGNLTGVRGDMSGVRGDLTGVFGDLSGVFGNVDDCAISPSERESGVAVDDLIFRQSEEQK